MAASQFISEEDLHAFADGETGDQTNAAVLAYLAASPIDAARVDMWRSQNELIRANFAKIEHEPIPLSLSLAPVRNHRASALVPFAPVTPGEHAREELAPPSLKSGDLAKLCAAVGIAFAAGMIAAIVTPHITGPIADLWPDRMLPMTGAPSGSSLPSRTLEMTALHDNGGPAAERINGKDDLAQGLPGGFNLPPFLLQDLAALELTVTGFQVKTASTDPALCLFLTTKQGNPLTLCMEKTESDVYLGYRFAEAPPFHSVDWPGKNNHFALAGRLSEDALRTLSQRINARIERPDKGPYPDKSP